MRKHILIITMLALALVSHAQSKSLHQLQQEFVDLRFGMFIHFNIPTFSTDDWPDPDMPATAFYPKRLDCSQWARAAKTAHMTYGCLTTKHHSGFCLWDTQSTEYNVMNSPLKRDVVREYVDAFRKEGLEVMLYYSILDTHHRLRPHLITRDKVEMIKLQLRELLTNYGPVRALIIDGWDAPWSRISYDEVPFKEIYDYVKSLQPECLIMDLNAAKYPREALFYTDIKSYEQGAGQKISTSENQLPALACLSIQRTWFWKETFPNETLKDPAWLVNENIIPYGSAYCNFILNVAPNRDGLMDDNALEALKEIGRLWTNDGHVSDLPPCEAPITEYNIAKGQPSESSWSYDYGIMDFANDDNFESAWYSNTNVQTPFWRVAIDNSRPVDLITITEKKGGTIQKYRLDYLSDGKWTTLFDGNAPTQSRVKIHRFAPVHADSVRLTIHESNGMAAISELGVYTPQHP